MIRQDVMIETAVGTVCFATITRIMTPIAMTGRTKKMNDDLITRLRQFASAQRCRDCILASECRRQECLFYRAADTLYVQQCQIEKLNEQIERMAV